jgi:hypothetical protein
MRQQDSRVGDRDRWLGLGLGPRKLLENCIQALVRDEGCRRCTGSM